MGKIFRQNFDECGYQLSKLRLNSSVDVWCSCQRSCQKSAAGADSLNSARNRKFHFFTAIIFAFTFLVVVFCVVLSGISWAQCVSVDANQDSQYYSNNIIEASADCEYGTENANLSLSATSPSIGSMSFCDYISKHVNAKYSSATKCEFANFVRLKQTLLDTRCAQSPLRLANLSTYIEDNAMLATFDDNCVVYNLDDNSPYYVGFVNTMHGQIADWEFARNNIKGQVLNDCIFEASTGLIYIPKAYTQMQGKDNKEDVLEVQCQLLYGVVPDANGKVATNIYVEIDNDFIGAYTSKTIVANALDTKIAIDVGLINVKDMQVLINDIRDVANQCTYDNSTLYVPVSACNTASIKITVKKDNLVQTAMHLFSEPVINVNESPASMNLLPGVKVNTETLGSVGTQTSFHTSLIDSETDARGNAYYPYLYGTWGVDGASPSKGGADQGSWLMWGYVIGVDLDALDLDHLVQPQTYINFQFYSNTEGNVFLDGANPYLPAKCIHIGSEYVGDIDLTKIYCRVLYIDENNGYAVIGFASAKRGEATQECAAYYKVAYESKGGIELDKSSELSWVADNPNYSLAGCKFNIYNDEACSSFTGMSLTTGADGHAISGLHDFKKGTYYLKEDISAHGTNYLANNKSVGRVTVTPNTYAKVKWDNNGTSSKSYSSTNCTNTPAYDDNIVQIAKCDAQSGAEVASGGASLENAEYEFEYFVDYFSEVDASSYRQQHSSAYRKHWVMSTNADGRTGLLSVFENQKISGDEFYRSKNGEVVCPLGTYVVHETKAPTGYLLSDKYYAIQVVADISCNNGASSKIYDGITGKQMERIYDTTAGTYRTKIAEQVIRGDVQFDKQTDIEGEAPQRLTKIPFKITSTTTGEWHVVVTDLNACVDSSSAQCPHTTNTNYFDCLLNSDGSVPSEGISEAKINAFYDEYEHAGVWFCFDTSMGAYVKGKTTAPNASCNELGSLPYDNYILEELSVSANEEYNLIKQYLTIDTPNLDVDLGTLLNRKSVSPVISTQLYEQKTHSKVITGRSAQLQLIDYVSYARLDGGSTYSVKTEIVRRVDHKIFAKGQSSFVADKSGCGIAEVAIDVDTTTLTESADLVAFEYVFLDGEMVACHYDIADSNQTIYIDVPTPKILSTTLHPLDSVSHVIPRAEKVELQDDVVYSGFEEGKTYRLVARLVNADGSVFYDSLNRAAVYGATFTVDSSAGKYGTSGTVSAYYSIDTSDLQDGAKIISFATIYCEDEELCFHRDLDSATQSVTVCTKPIEIFTNAVCSTNDSKEVFCTEDEVIIDTVSYFGAEGGYAYTLCANLIDKSTLQPVALTNAEGDSTYVKKQFIANASGYGTVDVCLQVDTRQLHNKHFVVYEQLFDHTGVCRATHINTDSYEQTVHTNSPSISTDLFEVGSLDIAGNITPERKNIQRYAQQHLIDRVEYSNLRTNTEYELKGVLVNKSTGESYINEVTGQPVTALYSFVPTESNGVCSELEYEFDSTLLPRDAELVSYVELKQNGGEVISHCILDDERETVKVVTPDISTRLCDKENDAGLLDMGYGETSVEPIEFIACKDKKLTDYIIWADLPRERNISLFNWLVNYETGQPVTDGSITDDEAVEAMSALVSAMGGYMVMVDDINHPSRYEVVFASGTAKVDMKAFSEVSSQYESALSHIAFVDSNFYVESDQSCLGTGHNKGNALSSINFDFSNYPAGKIVAMSVFVSENTVVATHLDMEDELESAQIFRPIEEKIDDHNSAVAAVSNFANKVKTGDPFTVGAAILTLVSILGVFVLVVKIRRITRLDKSSSLEKLDFETFIEEAKK